MIEIDKYFLIFCFEIIFLIKGFIIDIKLSYTTKLFFNNILNFKKHVTVLEKFY